MSENKIKNRSLLKLNDGRWVHYSRRFEKTILTRIPKTILPDIQEFSTEEFKKTTDTTLAKLLRTHKLSYSISQVTAMTFPALLFRADSLKISEPRDRERWVKIIQCLEELLEGSHENSVVGGEPRTPIPQTRLRRFYESLRLFAIGEIHGAFARYSTQAATHLGVLFEESFRHFDCYDNSGEPFYARNDRRQERTDRYVDQAKDFARCLLARLNAKRDTPFLVGDDESLTFSMVDYEISPRRTTKAMFEDGLSGRSSGSGGMDLLLECRGIPVVGEIKAKRDANMFFALVQGLMYAAELATENQLRRLKDHYNKDKEVFEKTNKTRCDLFIIYEETPKLLNEAKKIAKLLMQNGSVNEHIGRIAFLSAELKSDTRVEFKLSGLFVTTPLLPPGGGELP